MSYGWVGLRSFIMTTNLYTCKQLQALLYKHTSNTKDACIPHKLGPPTSFSSQVKSVKDPYDYLQKPLEQ